MVIINLGDVFMTEVLSVEQLKQYVSRAERLEIEKTEVLDNLKQVFDEAKANGFDTKILKKVMRLKKLDKNKLAEEEAMLDLYREALGV